jgi:alpha-tubulin suppressor-like RCC1 family protein
MKIERMAAAAALVAVLLVGWCGAIPAGSATSPPAPKAIVLTATPAEAVYSQAVRMTVAITPKGGGAPRGGTVTFLADGSPIGTAVATTRNTTFSTKTLPPGTHTITAAYDGDAVTAPATSGATTVTVGAVPTTTTVRPVTATVASGDRAELKATVLAARPGTIPRRPSGSVRFSTGAFTATVRVNDNGVATWRRVLPDGVHTVSATYLGDDSYAGSGPSTTTVTVAPPAIDPPITLDLGREHSCGLEDELVRCWGSNSARQIYGAPTEQAIMPTAPYEVVPAVQVAAGAIHTCSRGTDGAVSCWGTNNRGQLGVTDQYEATIPTTIPDLAGVTDLAAGTVHTCAVVAGGVRCWGSNQSGQIGDGGTADAYAPATVVGLTGVTAVTAGGSHSCALLTGGTVRCWGLNTSGQLGDGTTTGTREPVEVTGLTGVTAISAGDQHTCAIVTGGGVRCWGRNVNGQLGNGTFVASSTPVTVAGLTATSISAGGSHTCATVAEGTVWCWGWNLYGQLGNGITFVPGTPPDPSTVPVAVVGLSDVTALSAGNDHTCAVVADDSVSCWGDGSIFKSGIGVSGRSSTPVAVTGW